MAPFVWGFFAAVGFFAAFLEAVVLLAVRLTGADATEAAGIVGGVCVCVCVMKLEKRRR